MEKRSLNILQNVFLCVSQKKDSPTGLEWHEVEFGLFLVNYSKQNKSKWHWLSLWLLIAENLHPSSDRIQICSRWIYNGCWWIWNYQKLKPTCYECQYQKRHVVKVQYVWKTLQMLHYNHCHQHLVFIMEHISALSLSFWLKNILINNNIEKCWGQEVF